MIKPFWEALRDGFKRIRLSHGNEVKVLRQEGVLIDEEGYHSYIFGDHKEYELAIEPILEDEDDNPGFLIALYKNRILLTPKLTLWAKKQTENK